MSAVIVLLPADPAAIAHPDGDPPEQLHVTLVYLGDDDLSPEQVQEVQSALAPAAAMPAIDALVSGAGVLGKDTAIVLLLESQEICDIHDACASACEQHMGEAERFPNYIPHLTIGYPEDDIERGEELLHHALPMVGDNISFDRLAIMNGDDVTEIPLGSAGSPLAVEDPATAPEDAPQYSFGRFAEPVATPAAPAPVAPAPGPGAAPSKPKRTVILVGMPLKDPSKVPYANDGLPYQSPEPYVALLEVKLRQNEVPEQLAQVLATVTLEPATSTCTKSLTASDVKPPRRAVLMDPAPLAAASEAIKASLEPYSVNVDDYPFVVQLGNQLSKSDVTALSGQSLDFAGMIAVLEDGTVVHQAGETASPPETTPPDTVAPT